ncbi:hypothetical protein SCP_0509310 [Sparassis crispa]|uniref:Uncharacterized protein n=1 Tax=Sparassis crispa TaxID=139825 RepID=A0A401GQ40_9APHY|nr:hypothetical protein SCP_0509310 [Sparassis crispa]GBE83874.1 hypothetical protein SCP_0509310 [Sparassis crispa]
MDKPILDDSKPVSAVTALEALNKIVPEKDQLVALPSWSHHAESSQPDFWRSPVIMPGAHSVFAFGNDIRPLLADVRRESGPTGLCVSMEDVSPTPVWLNPEYDATVSGIRPRKHGRKGETKGEDGNVNSDGEGTGTSPKKGRLPKGQPGQKKNASTSNPRSHRK